MAKKTIKELKPTPREIPADFARRLDLCWELYQLCKELKDAPKQPGKKEFPKNN